MNSAISHKNARGVSHSSPKTRVYSVEAANAAGQELRCHSDEPRRHDAHFHTRAARTARAAGSPPISSAVRRAEEE